MLRLSLDEGEICCHRHLLYALFFSSVKAETLSLNRSISDFNFPLFDEYPIITLSHNSSTYLFRALADSLLNRLISFVKGEMLLIYFHSMLR